MASKDYTEWLAINVLNEQQLVSYRSLSRALKVHSNLAKQMLYEFHTKQNAKRPGSVHATYLITGTKQQEVSQSNGVNSQQDGEDTVMASSPPLPSSSMPKPEEEPAEPVMVRTVMLCKQEHLEKAKATFESISGIHIYSLQANALSDVHVLTECNRKIAADYTSEDPLEVWKQYGTIQNPNVRRRTMQRKQPAPPPPVKDTTIKMKPAAASTKPGTASVKPGAPEKQSSKDSQDSKPSSAKAIPEPAAKKPSIKRENSDIFKSFAKGANKKPAAAKRQELQQSSASASPAPAPAKDERMNDFSDEDPDDAEEGAENDVVEQLANDIPEGKSKTVRRKELEAMMDQEDEMMEDAAEKIPDKRDEDEQMEDDEPAAIDKQDEVKPEPKETVTVENGRRRGRRRVMKKKTVKDEDGYLVTKEEAAWESFSEDEPAPKKIKVPPAANMIKPAAGGKKGGKPGQGNIMSFFNKG